MRKFLFLLVITSLFCSISIAQEKSEIFTVYLVRHAEKAVSIENPRNPPLTDCGTLRSESLANFFGAVNLSKIYSTDYIRTINTARPTSLSKNLDIEIYDANNLQKIKEMIMELEEDVLIVGHSNTTPVLAGLLIGEKLDSIHESIYNLIYQVIIYENGSVLNVFRSEFECNK